MIASLLERAQQLIELKRYAEAAKELQAILSQDPNSPEALALFSICQAEMGNLDEAIKTIMYAISRQPDNDYNLYLLALFFFNQQKFDESEKAIKNAISFQPHTADYFGLLSAIKLNQKEWQQALDYANQGLTSDPDNLQCLNVRSQALFKLDKKDDAYHTIQHALNQDPENELTHTNLGWTLLEQGEHKKALEHFREALKINPHYDYAKAGLVEALKARYWFYKLFLKYAFWLSNMKAKGQWIVILGLFFGIRILNSVARTNETLAVFITPVIYLYFAFAISTWIIEPLSNLFLRLNVYGRYALTKEEIKSSNFVGVALAVGLAGALSMLVSSSFLCVMILVYGISMMIPLASMYNARREKNKKILIAYAISLAVLGLAAMGEFIATNDTGILTTIYVIGIIAYQWIANALIIR
jgi:tetratricopeptide (TPR) repeat protein